MGPNSEYTILLGHPKTKVYEGRGRGRGPQKNKQLPQSPFAGYFYDEKKFALPSMSLILLREGRSSIKLPGCK
jgi:hypothetical protein